MTGIASNLLECLFSRALPRRTAYVFLFIMGFVAGAMSPGYVSAQSLDQNTRSYVTPFPAEDRYKLYVFGDSLGDGVWAGLYRAFKDEDNVEVVKKSRVSTGFVRTDYFDWNGALDAVLRAEKVHIAVVMVGANDMQAIRDGNKWHKVGTDEWREIYSRRVDRFIKRLKQSHVSVYWVGLPIMRSPNHNEDMQVMNEIFRERAFINGARFIDTWNGFADQFGRYSAYGPDLTGQIRQLRANDGVHFTINGYRKLAHFVEREIRRDLRQARAERNIPLAGDVEEQRRAVRRSRASQQPPRRPADREGILQADEDRTAGVKGRASRAGQLPQARKQDKLPVATESDTSSVVAGVTILRPQLSAAAAVAAGSGYAPVGEIIANEIGGGVTALASISPMNDPNLSAASRALPLTQRTYYRVLIRGEQLKPKTGRADDFSWPASGEPATRPGS